MSQPVAGGTNARPLDDTIAETGPGLPDDAVLDGELAPGELDGRPGDVDAQAARLRRVGWAPGAETNARAENETATEEAALAETEAHPS